MCWQGRGGEGGGGAEEVSRLLNDLKDLERMSYSERPACETDALDRAHPYEEPAYEVYKIEDF